MNAKLGLLVGIVAGNVLYDFWRHGLAGVEWYRVGFVAVFAALVLAVVPARWLERKTH